MYYTGVPMKTYLWEYHNLFLTTPNLRFRGAIVRIEGNGTIYRWRYSKGEMDDLSTEAKRCALNWEHIMIGDDYGK